MRGRVLKQNGQSQTVLTNLSFTILFRPFAVAHQTEFDLIVPESHEVAGSLCRPRRLHCGEAWNRGRTPFPKL